MITQSDFDYARAHPEAREAFVKDAVAAHGCPHFKDVTYTPAIPHEVRSHNIVPEMACLFDAYIILRTAYGIRGIKSDLQIYPQTFSKGSTLDDMLWCLDHEAQHAVDVEKGYFPTHWDTAVKRLVILQHRMKNTVKKGTFDDGIRTLMGWYGAHLEVNAYKSMMRNDMKRDISTQNAVHKMTLYRRAKNDLTEYNNLFRIASRGNA